MLLGYTVRIVTTVLTQANDKTVMLIISRSILEPTPTHGALKLDHTTIHTGPVCHAWSRRRGLSIIICMVINC